MNNIKKTIFKSGYDETVPPDPGTLYSFRRDGSQVPENPSFHIPTVNYVDPYGNPQTFYADPTSDICGSFYALSITTINYCLAC